ncbi:hypothetical protein QJQ45_003390 [Haematococcus lacustris]|nr:hypothetical protein QJQ45_003390 [Haematococcus lacustris]
MPRLAQARAQAVRLGAGASSGTVLRASVTTATYQAQEVGLLRGKAAKAKAGVGSALLLDVPARSQEVAELEDAMNERLQAMPRSHDRLATPAATASQNPPASLPVRGWASEAQPGLLGLLNDRIAPLQPCKGDFIQLHRLDHIVDDIQRTGRRLHTHAQHWEASDKNTKDLYKHFSNPASARWMRRGAWAEDADMCEVVTVHATPAYYNGRPWNSNMAADMAEEGVEHATFYTQLRLLFWWGEHELALARWYQLLPAEVHEVDYLTPAYRGAPAYSPLSLTRASILAGTSSH